jgi:hypothetical protein
MRNILLCATTASCLVATACTAHARSAYDGSWDLVFMTQRGACDPSYNFTVNIADGVITNPNLVRFRGYVARSGAVRASVVVQAQADSQTPAAAGRGAVTQEMRDARATGPRNECDISQHEPTAIWNQYPHRRHQENGS